MGTSNSSVLRMSGMNSGFDTENMVKALTATTKNKINTNERKVLKLQAQQDAYRSIITTMDEFKSKYFDVLKTDTYLGSSTIFNTYSSTLSNAAGTAGTAVTGVTCSSGNYSNPGTYDITVNNAATQATYTSSGTTGSALNLAGCTDASATYSMMVTYNGTTKNITFAGGDENAVRSNINTALADFGVTNDGGNIVTVGTDNKMAASDRKAVTASSANVYASSQTLDLSALGTGTNTFSVSIGDTTKTVTFSTVAADYFDDCFDENGVLKTVDDSMSEELASKIPLYNQVIDNYYESTMHDAYNAWVEGTDDTDKDALYSQYYAEMTASKYEDYKGEAKGSAYLAAVEAGTISSTEGDANYQSIADFAYSDAEFEATDKYQDYLTEIGTAESYRATYDASDANQYKAYASFVNTQSKADFAAGVTQSDATDFLNETNIKNNLESLSFAASHLEVTMNGDGTATVNGLSVLNTGMKFAITQSADSATDFGVNDTDTVGTANQVSTSMKLNQLGLTADANGKYNFSLNGTDFSFSGDITVREMMKAVNASTTAGVKMSFSTLTNTFSLTSSEYGKNASISFTDGSEGLLGAFGFDASSVYTAGENLNVTINGITVEASSNSYEVDGNTYTFSAASEGQTFTSEVKRDYSKVTDAIKSFVEDYNALIKTVYGYVDEEPNSKYYFLTDSDKEDLALSDTQEEKWEKVAKQGILYQDSNLTTIMSKMRTVLYNSVDSADGTKIGLYNIGITTSKDWSTHGTLSLNEAELTKALESYGDDIAKLFSDSENGIMTTFNSTIESAIKTSGERKDKGTLVQLAGVASTSSATDNSIYDQIKSLNTLIDTLNERYDKQQDRYWSMFSNMETQLGNINSQNSYISQLANM